MQAHPCANASIRLQCDKSLRKSKLIKLQGGIRLQSDKGIADAWYQFMGLERHRVASDSLFPANGRKMKIKTGS